MSNDFVRHGLTAIQVGQSVPVMEVRSRCMAESIQIRLILCCAASAYKELALCGRAVHCLLEQGKEMQKQLSSLNKQYIYRLRCVVQQNRGSDMSSDARSPDMACVSRVSLLSPG